MKVITPPPPSRYCINQSPLDVCAICFGVLDELPDEIDHLVSREHCRRAGVWEITHSWMNLGRSHPICNANKNLRSLTPERLEAAWDYFGVPRNRTTLQVMTRLILITNMIAATYGPDELWDPRKHPLCGGNDRWGGENQAPDPWAGTLFEGFGWRP